MNARQRRREVRAREAAYLDAKAAELKAAAEEQAYAALADEMNDDAWTDADMRVAFDPRYVELGGRYAAREGLAWPPLVGDFDRYYERRCAR